MIHEHVWMMYEHVMYGSVYIICVSKQRHSLLTDECIDCMKTNRCNSSQHIRSSQLHTDTFRVAKDQVRDTS